MLPTLPRFTRLVDLLRFVISQPERSIRTSTGDFIEFTLCLAPLRHVDGTPCRWPDWSGGGGGDMLSGGSLVPRCIHDKDTIYALVGVHPSWLKPEDIRGPRAS